MKSVKVGNWTVTDCDHGSSYNPTMTLEIEGVDGLTTVCFIESDNMVLLNILTDGEIEDDEPGFTATVDVVGTWNERSVMMALAALLAGDFEGSIDAALEAYVELSAMLEWDRK